MKATFTCPICGFDGLEEPPRSPSGGGRYEYCPSCDFQFGVTDDDNGFSDAAWRWLWIARGAPWSHHPDAPQPTGRDPAAQLTRLGFDARQRRLRSFRPRAQVRLKEPWSGWGLPAGATGQVATCRDDVPVYRVHLVAAPSTLFTVADEDLDG